MKMRNLSFASAIVCGIAVLIFATNCTKNSTPPPPVHDTTVVVKTDTVQVPPPPDPTVNLSKGLMLYLPFSGSMADSSGNNNPTAAVNGASLTYDAHGYANNAFGGNGANQFILVTNNGSIKFDTAFTASVDFMTLDETSKHVFLSMINFNDGYGASFNMGMSNPGTYKFVNYAVLNVTGGCSSFADTAKEATTTSNFTPDLYAWYNAILVYHRGTAQLYINGNLISTTTSAGTLANFCTGSNVVIGAWWNNDIGGFSGALDNVRLYNRVLTPHEIATLAGNYQVTSTGYRPPLVTH